MADTVVKTVEDVDKLFSQIVVNGETYDSNRYVPSAPVQVIEEPEPEPQQTEISQNPSVPSGQTIQGEDVYAVVLNDEQHNFVDPEEVSSRTEADTTLQGNINSINALIPSDTTTTNKLVNQSGIVSAVNTAVENAVADLDVPSVGGNGKYIKAISETNGKISATEGTIADTVESGNNNPVTSDAVNSAIAGASGDVTQQIADAIGALDVASAGGSGKYISAISETDGKISATEGNIDSSVTDGSSNPVTGGAVSSAITNAIGALDVASAGGSGKYISAISETDGKINAVEGTIDNAVNQNSSNPVTGGAVKTAIDNAISSVYKPAGDKTVAQLTSALLTAQNLGNVYNITDSGTTTSDFVEGAGHPIKAGDNVAVVDVGAPSSPSYKFDLIGGFIDLSNYIQKSQTLGLIKNDGSVDTTAYAKQSEMSVTPGTGTDSDKTTIQLKTGTSATVLTQHIPAGTSTPEMDGTGSAGSSTNYARADHVHPSDTSKADKVSNATNGNFAGLDSNGNITDSGKKASDFLPSDTPIPPAITVDSALSPTSTNPVQNKVINNALDGKADTEDLTIPTDAVLHYSFDELPDYPDGNADVRLLDNNTYDIQSTDYQFKVNSTSITITNNNGKVQFSGTIGAGTYDGVYIRNSYINNKIVKIKMTITALSGTVSVLNGADRNNLVATYDKVGTYTFSLQNTNNLTSAKNVYIIIDRNSSATVVIEQIYIGDGSYSTPVIDNANGENNATNNGGIAVKGVSGKGAYFPSASQYASIPTSKYPAPTSDEDKTLSLWLKLENYVDDSPASGKPILSIGAFNGLFGLIRRSKKIFAVIRTNTYDRVVSSDTLENNVWYHAVMVYSKQTLTAKLYINGVFVAETGSINSGYTFGSGTTVWNVWSNTYVYSNTPNSTQQPATIDDLLIFDRALSEQEVQALYYNHGNTPKYYPPLTMVDSELSTESSNPVENKVITSRLNEMTEIASSLPTDAVLHYSFDELPDYPDGTADVRLIDNNTYDIQSTNYKFRNAGTGATISNDNGNVKVEVTGNAGVGVLISNSYITNKILKIKIKVTAITGTLYIRNPDVIGTITQAGTYEYSILHNSTAQYNDFYMTVGNSTSCTFTVEQIYIGDGSYSTPVIDNANGEYNSTSQSGVAVSGVSGKGLKCFEGEYIDCGLFNLNKNFTISVWIKPDNNTSNLLGRIFLIPNVIAVRNGRSNQNGLNISLYGANGELLNSNTDIGDLLQSNKWTHLVITREGTTLKCYRDGIATTTLSLQNDTIKATTDNSFLSYSDSTRPQSYDDLLIFDRALSEQEVQALYYNKANTPKYYDLADYQLNSGEVVKSVCSQLPDSSGNVALTKSDVGLGNVENTGDSAVPVQNGTTKFTTGGAFDFFGKSASSASWLGKVFGRLMGRKWTQVTAWDSYTRTPTYANGLWVVGSSYHGLYWSEDGRTWTQCTGTSSLNLDSPVYANGLWVSSKQYWSTDGKSWTQGTGVNGELRVPIYANGLWVAGNFIDKGMWWSTDGKSWTQGTGNNTTCYMETPTYANGLWVAGNSIGDSTNGGLWWSTDGKSWTQGTGNNTTYSMKSPTYADGLWVAGSGAGNIYGAKGLWWSTDGKSWTQGTGNNTTLSMESPVFVDGLWISGAYEININLWKSTDGKDWTLINDTSSLLTPKYANEVWIAGSNKKGIWWSVNGLEWKQAITTSYYTRTPNYANGLWITGCDTFSGGIYYSDIEMALEDLTD